MFIKYQHSTMPTIWLRSMVASFMGSVLWTVFAARMKVLPIGHLLGMDPSSYLASVVPDHFLMFRRELSLFHAFTSFLPWLTAILVAVGDALMSNPAMPGYVGFAGSCAVGLALYFAGQPAQSGFWLSAGAWGMLALTDYFFEEKLTPATTIDIGPIAKVELEEDDTDDDNRTPNTGPLTSTATLELKVPGFLRFVLKKETISFDGPFKLLAVGLCFLAWWTDPYSAYSWVIWACVWMSLGSASKCCLPWLPNNGD